MSTRNRLISLSFYLLIHFCAMTQTLYGVGDWSMHMSYINAENIAEGNGQVFCATKGGLFYFDTKDNSITTLSKIDGLSGFSISNIAYHEALNTLMIVYEDGNIDLFNNYKIYNMSEITRSSIIGSKNTNQIIFSQNTAYMATDYGIVLVDIKKREVSASYINIGPNGTQIKVNAISFSANKDSLFAATTNGIMAASLRGYNLNDFSNWKTYPVSSGIKAGEVQGVALYNNKLMIGQKETDQSYVSFYIQNNSQWEFLDTLGNNQDLVKIKQTNNITYVVMSDTIYTVVDDSFNKIESETLTKPKDVVAQSNSDVVWFADSDWGLMRRFSSGVFEQRLPNGPANNLSFRFVDMNGDMVVLAGGYLNFYAPLFLPPVYHTYSNNTWSSRGGPGTDYLDMVYSPLREKYYIASFASGLVILDKNNEYSLINHTSKIQTPQGEIDSPFTFYWPGVRLSSLSLDNEENIWMTTYSEFNNIPSIFKIDQVGNWSSYTPNHSLSGSAIKIDADNKGIKWILILTPNGQNGIIAFDEVEENEKFINNSLLGGNLPGATTCFAIDKNDDVWVGTRAGIGILQNTETVFTDRNYTATRPIYEGRVLMADEVVNCITVDGANRKWIGTTSGAWLFNADGSELIYNFNRENSPLPSNEIIDIGVNGKTGEVFFSTNQGVISFWADATEATQEHTDVRIFPNPVKPDFQGLVGITGLANNATVKITDINGRMVFEQNSNGGMATWDGRDINGVKVRTGVYMVFSANKDGSNNFVGKIAFIE